MDYYDLLDGANVTKEDREEAILFYFSSVSEPEKKWISDGSDEESIDHRCVSLAKFLASYRNTAETRGFLVGIATVMKGVNGDKTP